MNLELVVLIDTDALRAGAESLNGLGDAFLKTVRGIERVQCAKVGTNVIERLMQV
jgi:hypothetical protein